MHLAKPASFGGTEILFVGGIHGVGKSTICAQASAIIGARHIIASDLIRAERKGSEAPGKRVESVGRNQDVLLDALGKTLVPNQQYLLDGHFALLSSNGEVVDIPLGTFQSIAPVAIALMVDDPANIATRLRERDGQNYEEPLLAALQERERINADLASSALNCPLLIFNPLDGADALEKFAASHFVRAM